MINREGPKIIIKEALSPGSVTGLKRKIEMLETLVKQDEYELPFNGTYWVEHGNVMAGCYPGSADIEIMTARLEALINARFGLIINLTMPDEINFQDKEISQYEYYMNRMAAFEGLDLSFIRFPIRDMGVPSYHFMKKILDTIDRALTTGRRVYIHCWSGCGRTGTVIGCYLIRHGAATPINVLNMIKILRSYGRMTTGASPETPEQENMVRSWRIGE